MHILLIVVILIVIAHFVGNGNLRTTHHYDADGKLTGSSEEKFYLGKARQTILEALAPQIEPPQPKEVHIPLPLIVLGFTVAAVIVLFGVAQVILSAVWRS